MPTQIPSDTTWEVQTAVIDRIGPDALRHTVAVVRHHRQWRPTRTGRPSRDS